MNADPKPSKSQKAPERAIIAESQKEKLALLTAQANEALSGIATVTKSDVVNLLLELHGDKLNKIEIDRLRNIHFDEVKFAQWMANRLREARSSGESISLLDLVARGRDLVDHARVLPARRPRKKQSREGQISASDGLPKTEVLE